MKKILRFSTLSLLIVVFSALGFVSKAGVLEVVDPQTYVEASKDDDHAKAYATLKNNSDEEIFVYHSYNVNLVEGQEWSTCFGTCIAPQTGDWTSSFPAPIKANSTTEIGEFYVQLHPHGKTGTSEITVRAWVEGYEEDFVEYTIVFEVGVSSVDDASEPGFSMSYPAPNPAMNQVVFNYDVASAGGGEIVIYNLLGKVVKSYELNDLTGKAIIPIYDLPEGSYFAALLVNGERRNVRSLRVSR